MPASEGTQRRMLEALIRANAVDKRWAEESIEGTDEDLADLETATWATADRRWRLARMNGQALVREAQSLAAQ